MARAPLRVEPVPVNGHAKEFGNARHGPDPRKIAYGCNPRERCGRAVSAQRGLTPSEQRLWLAMRGGALLPPCWRGKHHRQGTGPGRADVSAIGIAPAHKAQVLVF